MFDPKQPTILVKKADGTFAKVPLSEFKKMQGKASTIVSARPYPTLPLKGEGAVVTPPFKEGQGVVSVAPSHHSTPHRAPAHHKPATHHVQLHHPAQHHAPVHIKFHTEHAKPVHHAKPPDSAKASPGKMSRADAGSPLEEKLRIKSSAPLFSPKREKQVEEVLGKLGFSVAPEVLGRLKSLVLAKLKDIKSEDETRELLARSIKNGGLGLTESQVEKIIRSCREVEGGESMENASVSVLKGKINMPLMVEPPELPMVVSSSPPFQGGVGVVAEDSSRQVNQRQTPSSLPLGKGEMTIAKMVNESVANEPIFKLDTRPVMKQSMQDVTASSLPAGQAGAEMGPVEEIKSISLTDFRRLSGNPEEAAKRLQQKMFNLQEESFVWYLDALSAYHLSPLYTEYMQAVCQSLAERKSLANVLNMKNSIKLNEAVALMEMERQL